MTKKWNQLLFLKLPSLEGCPKDGVGLQKNCKSPLRLCETPPLVRGGAFEVAQLKSIANAAQRRLENCKSFRIISTSSFRQAQCIAMHRNDRNGGRCIATLSGVPSRASETVVWRFPLLPTTCTSCFVQWGEGASSSMALAMRSCIEFPVQIIPGLKPDGSCVGWFSPP